MYAYRSYQLSRLSTNCSCDIQLERDVQCVLNSDIESEMRRAPLHHLGRIGSEYVLAYVVRKSECGSLADCIEAATKDQKKINHDYADEPYVPDRKTNEHRSRAQNVVDIILGTVKG